MDGVAPSGGGGGGSGGGGGGFLVERTGVLGLRIYVLFAIAVAAVVVAAAAAAAVVWFLRSGDRRRGKKHPSRLIPMSSKEVPAADPAARCGEGRGRGRRRRREGGGERGSEGVDGVGIIVVVVVVFLVLILLGGKRGNIGWGRWYTMAELAAATGGFGAGNVIGEGGYGIVYRGVLADHSVVAVKYLLDNKGQAEKEFKVEVEVIGKVRHKNLVGLIGYCAEGTKRMLVYEYIDNGNLEQWLRGEIGRANPLTWDARMKIAIGTAKGIAYLHEGLEPKVVHRDIKSSNILLDKHWNPKVSDFGLAKLLGSGSSYVTTRVMGTFGYVAPEYACTGMLNEGSDIYSFGVLLMEIVSGRSPVDYKRPPGEVNLVEWFKGMVGSRRVEEVVDPLMKVPPSPRVLNRVVLVCLRCIDSDAQKRPKMGQIVHMLEGDEFPFRMEHRTPRESNRATLLSEKIGIVNSERSLWR
uniref:non-specific serine/threonine protein kinase n=1 Tax=Ananas comosus var. bracteatus TaxID=296719 RepID=A0A6V7Q2W9_ANACO|nr:unnamed protein product [Ananas comosus var. bracteatus]